MLGLPRLLFALLAAGAAGPAAADGAVGATAADCGGNAFTYAEVVEGAPRFQAVYELERPDVLLTDAWAKAVEQGRWPAQVRPHTSNRRHMLMEKLRQMRAGRRS